MSKSLAADFARELRNARQARGWTQAELAERVGIAAEVCGRLERGRVLPRADTLVRLAAALDVSTDTLLGRAAASTTAEVQVSERQAAYASDRPELRRLLNRLEGETPQTIRLLDALVSSFRASGRSRGRAR
jgi:transcriptional regulator with XRE-family HTH domain